MIDMMRRSNQLQVTAALILVGAMQSQALAQGQLENNTDGATGIEIATLERDTPVDFASEVLPMFKQSCLACHNTTKPKAGLVLETPQTIAKGSENGPVVVAGNSGQSLLLDLAAHLDDPHMPPPKNKVKAPDLTPEQLGILKLWIDQGAEGQVSAATVAWQHLPEHLTAIHSVAISGDSQFVACGRGHQIFIYHIPTGELITQLEDPTLIGGDGSHGLAHRDQIHALAFSPNGEILASGGYRIVKLWRRPRHVQSFRFSAATEGANSSENPMKTMAASPDGRWVAAVTTENSIALWDVANASVAEKLSGHTEPITDLCFSRDSHHLVSGSTDKTVRLWNMADRTLVASVETPAAVNAVLWMSGLIVSGGEDNIIRVWKVSDDAGGTLTSVRDISGHGKPVTCLDRLWWDAERIMSGSTDGTVRIWNIEDGQQLRSFDHGAPVLTVAARPNGRRIASGGDNNLVVLWNTDSGKRVAELKGDRYLDERAAAAESFANFTVAQATHWKNSLTEAEKNQKTIATDLLTLATDKATAIENVVKKEEEEKQAEQAKADAEKARDEAKNQLTQAENNKNLAEAAFQKVAEFSTSSAKLAAELKTKAEGLGSSAQTKLGAATEAKKLLDAAKADAEAKAKAADQAKTEAKDKEGEEKAKIEQDAAAKQKAADEAKAKIEPLAADYEPKQKLADAAKAIADLAAKDAEEERLSAENAAAAQKAADEARTATNKSVERGQGRHKKSEEAFKASEESVKKAATALGEARNGRKTAINKYHEGTLTVRDGMNRWLDNRDHAVRTKNENDLAQTDLANTRKAASENQKPIRAVAFSPDNQRLAMAGDAHTVSTFIAGNGKPCEIFAGHKTPVTALAFTHAGDLVSSSSDRDVIAWSLKAPWELAHVIGSGDADSTIVDRVLTLGFNQDGDMLASGGGRPSRDGQIQLWRVQDGSFIREFADAHSDTVFGLEFSPDGHYLASASADTIVKVFHVGDGTVAKSFQGHTHHALDVSWNKNGQTLASSGADKAIKLWNFLTGQRAGGFSPAKKEVTSIRYIGYTDQTFISAADPKVSIYRPNGEHVRTFEGPTEFTFSCDVSRDGKTFVAGGQDGILYVWDDQGRTIAKFDPPNIDRTPPEQVVVR